MLTRINSFPKDGSLRTVCGVAHDRSRKGPQRVENTPDEQSNHGGVRQCGSPLLSPHRKRRAEPTSCGTQISTRRSSAAVAALHPQSHERLALARFAARALVDANSRRESHNSPNSFQHLDDIGTAEGEARLQRRREAREGVVCQISLIRCSTVACPGRRDL